MKMKLLPLNERENIKCHFCGTNKSVKYTVKTIEDRSLTHIVVPCCNKCVWIYSFLLEDF